MSENSYVAGYERGYQDAVAAKGKLSFGDLLMVFGLGAGSGAILGALVLRVFM